MEPLSVLNFGDWSGYIFLITLRVLASFTSNPVMSNRRIPNIAKIVLSIFIAYLVFNATDISVPLEFRGTLPYMLACLKEVCLGLTFGMIINMCMSCVYLAGHIIDVNLGFGFSHLYDTNTNTNANISGVFFNIILVLLFFTSDAHVVMFRTLADTFAVIPPGKAEFNPEFVRVIVDVFVNSFTVGVQISMPVLAVALTLDVLLGVVMKSVPQLHFFVIGFPLKIVLGFMTLYIMIPIFSVYSSSIFETMFSYIQKVFMQIGAG